VRHVREVDADRFSITERLDVHRRFEC
jgi:hypothetical protein